MSEEEIQRESDMEDKTSEEFLQHWENSYVLFEKKSAETINEFLGCGPLFVEICEQTTSGCRPRPGDRPIVTMSICE